MNFQQLLRLRHGENMATNQKDIPSNPRPESVKNLKAQQFSLSLQNVLKKTLHTMEIAKYENDLHEISAKCFKTSKHHSLFWRLALSTSLVASRQTLESQNFQLQLDSICPGNSLLGQNPVAQNSRFQVGTWHRSLQGAILDKYVHI